MDLYRRQIEYAGIVAFLAMFWSAFAACALAVWR
jgi:hypothetical protein